MSVQISLALTALLVLGGILIWLNVPHRPEKLANDAEEQYRIGKQYLYGTGVDRDYAEALRRFHKAAAQGHAGAQTNLGVMYANGQGVAQDDAQAVQWFRKAAVQGHADAQNALRRRGLNW